MAAPKKELLIEYELEFLEKKLQELKKYIESNPYSKLKDRETVASTLDIKDGLKTVYKVVASKEAQRKDLTQALKDYAEILRTVDAMRTSEKGKTVAVRGDEELGSQAKNFLKNREK